MQSPQDRSIEELKTQSELARANLTATVSELRGRFSDTTTEIQAMLSPSNVKEEVKSYARRTSDDVYQRIETRIRQNPLQAAAIGAGLAYPVLSILRRMPVPLMLLGAGFWFAGQQKSRPQPTATRAGETGSALQQAGKLVSDAPSIVSDLGQQVGEHLERTAAAASEKLAETANAASDKLSETANAASERFSQVAASVSQTASESKAWGNEAFSRSQRTVSDFINQNPMLVAGLGIGAGAFLAALLPATRVERNALAPVGARLREGATAAAAQGMTSIRSAADAKVAGLADDLEREGLGPQGLAETAGRLVDSAKAVAERGLQAALGDEPSAAERPKQNEIGEGQ